MKRKNEGKSPLFAIESVCGKARAGRLFGMETPALLSQTSLGSPPFLTEDLVAELPSLKAFALSFCDMHSIRNEAAACESLRKYLNSTAQLLFLTTRDPIAFPVSRVCRWPLLCADGSISCAFGGNTGSKQH